VNRWTAEILRRPVRSAGRVRRFWPVVERVALAGYWSCPRQGCSCSVNWLLPSLPRASLPPESQPCSNQIWISAMPMCSTWPQQIAAKSTAEADAFKGPECLERA
jgi:hypothetical protein